MARRFLDLLYPRSCAACGRPAPGHSPHLCWDCNTDIVYVQPPFCSTCGRPVWGMIDHEYTCSECHAKKRYFDRARSAVVYDGVVRDMLMSLKYHKALWLCDDLSTMLYSCVQAHYEVEAIDAIVCVPLHPAKRRERGFNQAEGLARSLAGMMHKSLLVRSLARVRPTASQTNLTAQHRLANVKEAFEPRWSRWLESRRILLVDDVMTTGATVNDCARALKEGGAARVDVVTVARGT